METEASITLDHLIRKEQLAQVYKIFCECYGLELDEKDLERFLLGQYKPLIRQRYFDQRPGWGSKFFGKRERGRHIYAFHGYNGCLSEDESEEACRRFIERVGEEVER